MKLLLERWFVAFSILLFGTATSLSGQKPEGSIDTTLHQQDDQTRSKRSLVYTYNSCSGVLFAMSIPLLITGRNIFMSYNFESNYNMPTTSTDFTQGILKKGDNDQIEGGTVSRQAARSAVVSPRKRATFTRKKVYRTIDVHLRRYGFAGKRCILRMICDVADAPLHHENGVLGDLLQLIFTPSMSRDENLPSEFYRAEELGRNHRDCSKYRAHCPTNPLDLVSIML